MTDGLKLDSDAAYPRNSARSDSRVPIRQFELVSAGFMNHHSIVSVFSSSLDAAAVAMLGPGAYSLDSRRFGRRVIRFPREETSNRR
jgi:hypothetical protein